MKRNAHVVGELMVSSLRFTSGCLFLMDSLRRVDLIKDSSCTPQVLRCVLACRSSERIVLLLLVTAGY